MKKAFIVFMALLIGILVISLPGSSQAITETEILEDGNGVESALGSSLRSCRITANRPSDLASLFQPVPGSPGHIPGH